MHVCYPSMRTWVWILSNSNKKIQNGSKCPSPLPFESGDEWIPEGHWPASLTKLMGFNFSKTPVTNHKDEGHGRKAWSQDSVHTQHAHSHHRHKENTNQKTCFKLCFIVQFRRKPKKMDVRMNLLSSEYCPHSSVSIILHFFCSASAPLLWQSWQSLTKHYITPILL